MYTTVGFTLTEGQAKKLAKAKQQGEPVVLEITQDQIGGEHELYLTKPQIMKLEKTTGGTRLKFSKTQVKAQKGGFLGAIMKILPKVLPVLGTLGLAAATGAISGATHKAAGGGLKRAGGTIPLHFKKEDLKAVINAIGVLEENEMLAKGTCKKCMYSIKKQEGGFIGALLATLATVLPSLLGGKGLVRAGKKK